MGSPAASLLCTGISVSTRQHDTDDMLGKGRFFTFSRQQSENADTLGTPWSDGDGFEWVAELEVLGCSLRHTCHRRGRPDTD